MVHPSTSIELLKKKNITPIYEEVGSIPLITLLNEIGFDDEEEVDDELLNFKTEFDLFIGNSPPQNESCIDENQKMHEDETYSSSEYDNIFLAKHFPPDNTEIAKKPTVYFKGKGCKKTNRKINVLF